MIDLHALNSLSEKVYTMYDVNDKDDTNYELSSFFSELMKRRRNDDVEEGLQAGGIIYPDRAAFKVSEKDGRGSHAQAQENASQYINGETSFTGAEAVGILGGERRKDPNAWVNLPKNGFTVRVVAAKELMIFIFNTYSNRTSDFQFNVISKLVDFVKESYQSGEIKYPLINYVEGNKRFIFDESGDYKEQLDKLESMILERKEINKKTRSR